MNNFQMKYSQALVLVMISSMMLTTSAKAQEAFKTREVYRSSHLVLIKLTPETYQHISYLQTEDFGNVPCNGLIVNNQHEAIVFDTPTDDQSAQELIKWIKEELKSSIVAIVPTHFHNDCLGSLSTFIHNNIPSFAHQATIELARKNNSILPGFGFEKMKTFKVGREKVIVSFQGEGHTSDNIIAYYNKEHVLFGGCLIKEIGATKGFLGDANVKEWSATVQKIKKGYPDVKIVVPGHGRAGNSELLDYTIGLFRNFSSLRSE